MSPVSSDRPAAPPPGTDPLDDDGPPHRIECRLDAVLRERGLTLTELSAMTGMTMANLSILKTNKARAIRFSTLTLLCDLLGTTPGELFTVRPRDAG